MSSPGGLRPSGAHSPHAPVHRGPDPRPHRPLCGQVVEHRAGAAAVSAADRAATTRLDPTLHALAA